MNRDKWLGADAPTARRLRIIMTAFKQPTQIAFANFLGVNYTQLNNLLNGAPISRDVATKILHKTGVDPSYVWFGSRAGMAPQLTLALDSAEAELDGGKGTTRADSD